MKRLKHNFIFKNKYGYKLWNDLLINKNGDKFTYDYVVQSKNYVVIIPIDQYGNLYFVRHYRYPINRKILELPVGYINRGETPRVAAKRELYEEIGAKSSHIRSLGFVWQIPGFAKIKCHIFLATDIITNNKPKDSSEDLEVIMINKKDLRKLIQEDKIEDSSSLCAIVRYLAIS